MEIQEFVLNNRITGIAQNAFPAVRLKVDNSSFQSSAKLDKYEIY